MNIAIIAKQANASLAERSLSRRQIYCGAGVLRRNSNREAYMLNNVGTTDRWIRVLVGIALLTLVIAGPKTDLGWLGMIPLATGLFGYCPLYQLFGWSTKRAAGHP